MEEPDRRTIDARLGICALNLLFPGLGLIRLARYRQALAWILVLALAFLTAVAGYVLADPLQFDTWLGIVAVAVVLALVAYVGSIVASWRASRFAEPRAGHGWRWYGVLGIWLASTIVMWPLADLARSYHRGFYLPSQSMAPTLLENDRFMVDMHSIDPIGRGDVVIVTVDDEMWIKRVAAIPGDRIAMKGGVVMLNGKAIEQQLVGTAKERTNWGPLEDATTLREQFPGEAAAHLIRDTGMGASDDSPEIELPAGGYFLLGDNRDNSMDSRHASHQRGMGIVDRDAIVGRYAFRYWRDSEGFGPGED